MALWANQSSTSRRKIFEFFAKKKRSQHLRSCTYLNPDVRHRDAMHTTLSLVHNVSKEETKKKSKILYFFYRSKNVVTYQHRASKIKFFIYVRYTLVCIRSDFLIYRLTCNVSSIVSSKKSVISVMCIKCCLDITKKKKKSPSCLYVLCAVVFSFFFPFRRFLIHSQTIFKLYVWILIDKFFY